ncbi:unnamed protein product [Ixodes persulcatus]
MNVYLHNVVLHVPISQNFYRHSKASVRHAHTRERCERSSIYQNVVDTEFSNKHKLPNTKSFFISQHSNFCETFKGTGNQLCQAKGSRQSNSLKSSHRLINSHFCLVQIY